MQANPLYALIPIAVAPGTTALTLDFTAAISIPAGFWLVSFGHQVAAQIL
jgi:hypothetical protein